MYGNGSVALLPRHDMLPITLTAAWSIASADETMLGRLALRCCIIEETAQSCSVATWDPPSRIECVVNLGAIARSSSSRLIVEAYSPAEQPHDQLLSGYMPLASGHLRVVTFPTTASISQLQAFDPKSGTAVFSFDSQDDGTRPVACAWGWSPTSPCDPDLTSPAQLNGGIVTCSRPASLHSLRLVALLSSFALNMCSVGRSPMLVGITPWRQLVKTAPDSASPAGAKWVAIGDTIRTQIGNVAGKDMPTDYSCVVQVESYDLSNAACSPQTLSDVSSVGVGL